MVVHPTAESAKEGIDFVLGLKPANAFPRRHDHEVMEYTSGKQRLFGVKVQKDMHATRGLNHHTSLRPTSFLPTKCIAGESAKHAG